jgi:gliding motility-associated-like protein
VGTPTGGSGDYLYTLITTLADGTVTSNGPQAANTFPNLGAAESYQVKVSDSWTCSTVSGAIKIDEPAEVKASLVLSRPQTCDVESELTLTVTGGTPPYTYSTNNTSYSTATFSSSISFDVPVGTYRYYVKDANDCVSYVSNDIKIDPLPTLVIILDERNTVVNCKGYFNGVIVATAQGGLGNYVYTLFKSGVDITTTITQTTPGNFTQLAAGLYEVEVTSGVDCGPKRSGVIEIEEPTTALTAVPTTVNVSCAGERNGKIIITAAGGTGIIRYAISPNLNQFFEGNIFENLKPDFYDLIAQDENGCYVYMTGVAIIDPKEIIVATTIVQEEICFGDKDGAFDIDISEGTAPYKVSVDKTVDLVNPNYVTLTAADMPYTVDQLTGGDHTVYVIDANGCTAEWLVTMAPSVKLAPVATVEYGCFNNAPSNTVTVTVDASITNPADVDYALVLDGIVPSPLVYQMSPVFSDVPPGNHFIRARHTNGCTEATPSFTIDQVDPLALAINDGDLNQIKAIAAGGAGEYQYSFNGEDFITESTYAFYKSGNYTVIVRDKNGCTVTVNRDFTYIDVCIPNYFTPNGDGTLDDWGPGCTNNYPNLTYDIFDRYGRVIAKYRIGQKWDGKYNGEELPSGDYWYVLRLNNDKDNREFVGHFTLYR